MKSAYATDAPHPGMKADLVKYARLIVTKGSGAGATLGLNILLARLLVPELAGTVFFCVALGISLSLLARLGWTIPAAAILVISLFVLIPAFRAIPSRPRVVIVAGSPPGIPGSTNALRVHRMGDAINELAPAYRRPSSPAEA